MTEEYRKCVGMIIINHNNEILVGRRIDHPSGYWQMPQGGIDKNEIPEEAVWREMMEEIGTNNANLIQLLVEVKLSLTDLNFCLRFKYDFFSNFFFQRICLYFKL